MFVVGCQAARRVGPQHTEIKPTPWLVQRSQVEQIPRAHSAPFRPQPSVGPVRPEDAESKSNQGQCTGLERQYPGVLLRAGRRDITGAAVVGRSELDRGVARAGPYFDLLPVDYSSYQRRCRPK